MAVPAYTQAKSSQLFPPSGNVGGSESAPSLPIDEIVKKIMVLESSGGKNNYSKCEAIGKFNRYGFGIPGNGKYLCFEKDEDTKAVEKWFSDKLKQLSLKQSVCLYNTGETTDDCPYLRNFQSI